MGLDKTFFVCLPLLAVGALTAGEPAPEALKATEGEVRDMMPGGHTWKWRFRAAAPYKAITVRLLRYTRTASGEFARHTVTEDSYVSGRGRNADEILIVCGDKDGMLHYAIALPLGRGKRVTAFPGVTWKDYRPTGAGTGGVPARLGTDFVLLARHKGGQAGDKKGALNKDDLEAYIAVDIKTE
jgi:hypothetical protein